jgi:hypothetical protein
MNKKKRLQRVGLITLGLMAALIMAAAVLVSQATVAASSHREAPLISKDQFADTTDVYVWIPEGVTDTIAIAASWIPFEGPEGGPKRCRSPARAFASAQIMSRRIRSRPLTLRSWSSWASST